VSYSLFLNIFVLVFLYPLVSVSLFLLIFVSFPLCLLVIFCICISLYLNLLSFHLLSFVSYPLFLCVYVSVSFFVSYFLLSFVLLSLVSISCYLILCYLILCLPALDFLRLAMKIRSLFRNSCSANLHHHMLVPEAQDFLQQTTASLWFMHEPFITNSYSWARA